MISFYFQSFYRVMEARQTLDGKRGVITVIFEALKTVLGYQHFTLSRP